MSDTEPRAFEVACKPGGEFEYMVFTHREQAVCYLDPVEGEPEQEVIPLYSQLLLDRKVREAVDGYQSIASKMEAKIKRCCGGRTDGEHCDICLELDCWATEIRARQSEASRRQSVDKSNEKGT